jgi:alpha-tubulin suppressor-like RCC1 family protein
MKDREFEWSSGSMYFFYPLRQQSIVCFGINDNNQMGKSIDGSSNFYSPNISKPHEEVPKDFKPVKCWGNHTYSMVQGADGKLIECGHLGSSVSDKSEFKLTTTTGLPKDFKLDQVEISYHNMWALLQDGSIWYRGSSSSYVFPGNDSKSSWTEHKIWPKKEDEEKIVSIAGGYRFAFFVTEKGKLYARGDEFTTLIKQ